MTTQAHSYLTATIFMLLTIFTGCGGHYPKGPMIGVTVSERAMSLERWTGVAVTEGDRLFVNYPRWSDDIRFSVAEFVNGRAVAWPDREWNGWEPGDSPVDKFVCVQSVHFDRVGRFWVLDPANPKFEGVVQHGPKLMRFDLLSGALVQSFRFDESIAPQDSYLNDVRIDVEREVAYISDSGKGGLVVVDLRNGAATRALDGHPSTMSEDSWLKIGGKRWKRSDGSKPQVHCDGLALDLNNEYLYYQALTGRSLYRVPTSALIAALRSPSDAPSLPDAVEYVTKSGASDAIEFGQDGYLYLTSLEYDAIRRVDVATGETQMVKQDKRFAWPDSFAIGPDGAIYFTTAQIHLGPNPRAPYRVFRLNVTDLGERE